jgi:hypothetical protein
MTASPVGITVADWLSWPADSIPFLLAQQQEIRNQREQREDLLVPRQENAQSWQQLTALATELASLRVRIGCNSSKPPSSDGQGFKPPL